MSALVYMHIPACTVLKDKVLGSAGSAKRSTERDFAVCLAVNHTVVMEHDEATGKKVNAAAQSLSTVSGCINVSTMYRPAVVSKSQTNVLP